MKTAISIPDEVFAEAERLAKRQKKSRSKLYADAIAEYVARHDDDRIIESINAVVNDPEAADPELDAFVAAWARRTLERTEW
jgi:metal-responsive CopG/Arc/MetJ family transcriptional regulator